DKELRGKLDDYVSDPKVSFKALKKRVLDRAQGMYQISKMLEDSEQSDRERSRYRSRSFSRVREGSANSVGTEEESDRESCYSERYILAIGRDTTGIKCYRCLKPGHSASTCLATEPADIGKRCIRCGSPSHMLDKCNVKIEKAICRRCKFPGHLAYTCRTNVKAGSNETSTPTARGRIAPNAKVHMIGRIRGGGDKNGESIDEVENHRVASTNTGHVPMVIGEVILEGKPVSAVFDTGAEVSLVTISTLKECVPMATVECRHVPKVSVAGGAVMEILGMVQLTVAIGSNAVIEWFIVTEDTMTVPVLLGCSTLARLNTRITLTPEGVRVDMSRVIEGGWVSTIEKFSDGEGEQPSDYDSINDYEDEFKDTLPKTEDQDLDLIGHRGQRGQRDKSSDDVDCDLLLVHDHVVGRTCVRPLCDSRPENCGAHFVRRDAKGALVKHGVEHPGIIFPGLGGVDIDDVDNSKVTVPEEYGKPEVFALKNVVHAAALQGVIYEYLDRGVRVYLDADGTLKEMKLQDGDDDCELVRRARAKTELKRLAKKAEEAEGLGLPQGSLLPPGVEPLGSTEDEEDVQLPPNVNPDVSSEEEPSDSSEEDDTEDRRIVDVPSLRERLGMAVVLECEEENNEDKILLRPMKVELFDGCITVKKIEDVDLVNAELHSLIYVSPDSRHWSRRRTKEVLQLLEDINARGFGSTI
ncbi:hypothetical protein FOZ63_002871, partial [Perkinsus olseni]